MLFNTRFKSFANVLNTDKWLAVRGHQDADGTPLMTYTKSKEPQFEFKLTKPGY